MTGIRISADDGCASDMRLAELCTKYDTELIFYWPFDWKNYAKIKGFKPLLVKDAIELSHSFEIGSHTITHPLLTQIPEEDAKHEIWMSKIYLQQKFGKPVRKFAPPRGYMNYELMKFAYLHYKEIRMTKGDHLVHIHPNSGANDNKPWREAINDKTTELWCHSWELDKFNLWDELEAYLKETADAR